MNNRSWQILFSILVEVCYLYPLYYMLNTGFGSIPALLPGPVFIFAVAVFGVNYILARGSWRHITVWLGNLLLIVFGIGQLVHRTLFAHHAFFTRSWLSALFTLPFYTAAGLRYWSVVALLGWLWYRAVVLVRQPPDIDATVTRFDLSIAALFVLFFVAAINDIPFPAGMFWLFALFACNSIALALAQGEDQLQGQFTWMGPLFLCLLLLPIVLGATVLLPWLSATAGLAYTAASPLVRWFGGILLRLLIWIFGAHHGVPEIIEEQPSPEPEIPEVEPVIVLPDWLLYILQPLAWLLMVVLVLFVILVLVYLFYLFVQWLWRRQEGAPPPHKLHEKQATWWQGFCTWLRQWLKTIHLLLLPWLPGNWGVATAYGALLSWGLRRNCPRRSAETPYEYLQRLGSRFPEKKEELNAITACYVAYYYGNKPVAAAHKQNMRRAVRRLYQYRRPVKGL
ncbi:MAG: DUF4129 domain-containing protein [bacterium]